MEFKADSFFLFLTFLFVDIGTEWNLKRLNLSVSESTCFVDIGTEWNLKKEYFRLMGFDDTVDIGTEWNLKKITFSVCLEPSRLI